MRRRPFPVLARCIVTRSTWCSTQCSVHTTTTSATSAHDRVLTVARVWDNSGHPRRSAIATTTILKTMHESARSANRSVGAATSHAVSVSAVRAIESVSLCAHVPLCRDTTLTAFRSGARSATQISA